MAEIKTYLLRAQAVELFKRSLLLALLIHLFGLVAVPEYKIKIKGMEEKKIEALDLPPEMTIPEKKKIDVPRPSIPVEAEEDEDIPDDVTIEETILDETVEAPTAPPPSLPEYGKFVPFDTKPEPIRYVTPEYPEMAKKAGIEGVVTAQLLIGTDGKVYDCRVVAGPEIFYAAVEKAARRCLFSPAKQRDKPVAVWVAVPFRFSLKDVG